MNNIKSLDRRDLILAVWAAEFTRALGGTAMSQGGAGLHAAAFSASRCADRAVEALRLLADVEFRIAVRDDLNNHYMRWEQFVEDCRGGMITGNNGSGELATRDHHISNIRVYPSEALRDDYQRPDWATHVCWYNK